MKKLTLLFLVLVLKFAPAKAQWVTIPDANFVTWLNTNYPSCMNGNQMDTTCSQIVISETVNVQSSNISNLFGIQYFDNLYSLDCTFNQLTSLPTLPSGLNSLICYNNQLTSLPTLPQNISSIFCNQNQLTSLPALPNSLSMLYCGNNQLSSLPPLSNGLYVLYLNNNLLTSLPPLSSINNLNDLRVENNLLGSLPSLPPSLTSLTCEYNQLTSLPSLPNGLTNLYCRNNQLQSLPILPNTLANLNASYNQLTWLPQLPNSMQTFVVRNNNISCVENLPNVADAGTYFLINNPLTCVPNQTIYSLGLPLCIDGDNINNPNNCPNVGIAGTVYKDLNGNCIYNAFDRPTQNIPIELYDNQNNFLAQSFTINGLYSFANLLPDTFQVKIDTTNLPIAISCGQTNTQSVILTTASQTIQNINFPVVCNAAYDVAVQSVVRSGWVFPGQIHTLATIISNNSNWFNLNCFTASVPGTVSIQLNGPVSFVGSAAGTLTPTINGNIYTYNISNLNSFNLCSIGMRLMIDTTAQATDQICVHVEVSPNPIDANTTNNVYDFCYNVVNSYDPNMKEVYPVNVLPGYNDWFTYTIHFQNTGNAPSFNIRLRDTLDTQLDLNTFEVLGYSHPANISLNGNILTVRFNNIMLPDSTSDYEGSIGYFQYRLKPIPNLPNGSQINNTAYIYFDYNAPIVTNTTTNNFEFPVKSLSIVSSENSFSLYPNPSTGVFTFKDIKNLNTVEVYSILGEKILSQTNQKTINLNGFSKGVYFARVNGGVVLKMVKE